MEGSSQGMDTEWYEVPIDAHGLTPVGIYSVTIEATEEPDHFEPS